jgi:hypothetical protein
LLREPAIIFVILISFEAYTLQPYRFEKIPAAVFVFISSGFYTCLGDTRLFFWGKNYFEPAQQILILLQIVIITILIPMAFIYLLKTLGKVDSIMIADLSQRKIPLVIQIVLMVILLRQSITLDRIPELFFFFAGGILSALLTLILLFAKVKASLHTMGISALTVFTMGLSINNQVNLINVIAILLTANGLVAASRLQMKAHTGTELAVGFFGITPQLLFLYYWL